MGLDMYLEKRTYIWSKDRKSSNVRIRGVRGERVSEVTESVMVWRKANHIHKWFVDNVQAGKDDCDEHYVSRESLEELLNVCEQVLKASKLVKGKVKVSESLGDDGKWHKNYEDGMVIKDAKVAKKLLPTSSGFFFGGTEYGEYYYNDVKNTRDSIKKLLEEEGGDFYYSSSW